MLRLQAAPKQLPDMDFENQEKIQEAELPDLYSVSQKIL